MGELRSTFSNNNENNPSHPIEPIKPEEDSRNFEELLGKKFHNKDSGDYQVVRIFSQELGSIVQWSVVLESLDNPRVPNVNKPIDETTGKILDPNNTWSEIE